jgi:hypothetical protein
MRWTCLLLGLIACGNQAEPMPTTRMELRKVATHIFGFGNDDKHFEGKYLDVSLVGRALAVEVTIRNPCDWPVAAVFRMVSDTMDIAVLFEPYDPRAAFDTIPLATIEQATVCTTGGDLVLVTYAGRIKKITIPPTFVRLWAAGRVQLQDSVATAAS